MVDHYLLDKEVEKNELKKYDWINPWNHGEELWFSIPCILATQCDRPYSFKTINSVTSNIKGVQYDLSWEYPRCTASGCKDIRIIEFVAKKNPFLTAFRKGC